ncbi:MAG: AmmeMemoRadiSam system protein A [Armatimonadota bacterium]
MDGCSPYVNLAMKAVTAYVTYGKTITPPPDLPLEFQERAGVFVSFKKYGELRGCIGTIEPAHQNIAHEIIKNAINAATRDPRFLAVEPDELSLLTCSVDVLSPPEPIDDVCLLHPAKYGVIVRCGKRRGLLLPNLEGVDTVEEQIDIACRKAMIQPNEHIDLYRFEVKRYY